MNEGTVGVVVIVILIAALVGGGAYLIKRSRERKLASMTPEQRRLHEADRELNAADKEHKRAVKAAEKELRGAVRSRERLIMLAEFDLAKTRARGKRPLGSYRGEKGATIQLFADHVETPEGQARFEDGSVTATVDTAGNLAVTRRGTITRTVLLGGIGGIIFKKAVRHDTRELYLLIESPNLVSIIQGRPDDGSQVRKFAVQINHASRSYASVLEAHERDVVQAERALRQRKDDRAAIEAAETKLTAAEGNTARLDEARIEVDRLRAEGTLGA
ncbi:MAG: hypothetical protein M3Q49_05725 [Actinomycetota bacterium]|nr:hypothetical protein [Actinomycetota bacterium]